jgi:hypothetical protein
MTVSPSQLPRLVTILCLLTFVGCHTDVAPVSGRVTLDGRPLPDAVVTFQPKSSREKGEPAGTGSAGRTDDDGRYFLRLIQPDKAGAVIGEHSVTISAVTGGSDEVPAKGRKLPKTWADGSKRFKVPAGGTAAANFEITTGPAARK